VFKIFENLTIEDVPDLVINEIIKEINLDPTIYNKMFLKILASLEDLLRELNNDKSSVISNSFIEYIITFEFSAKSIQLVINDKKELIKIMPSEVESIKLNTSSIINAVEQIKKIQNERLGKLNPEELLVVLTTWIS